MKKEWDHEPHAGETPPSIIPEVLDYSSNAVAAADAAAPLVTKNRDEFERLRNDVYCIQTMAENYSAKVKAAELVLRYNYSHDIADMEQAEKYLAESFADYQKLAALTDKDLSLRQRNADVAAENPVFRRCQRRRDKLSLVTTCAALPKGTGTFSGGSRAIKAKDKRVGRG